MDCPHHDSSYVAIYGAGDETLAIQSTVIWILPMMTLCVCLQVVAEFEFTATHIAQLYVISLT